jgi:hypothetical protein
MGEKTVQRANDGCAREMEYDPVETATGLHISSLRTETAHTAKINIRERRDGRSSRPSFVAFLSHICHRRQTLQQTNVPVHASVSALHTGGWLGFAVCMPREPVASRVPNRPLSVLLWLHLLLETKDSAERPQPPPLVKRFQSRCGKRPM